MLLVACEPKQAETAFIVSFDNYDLMHYVFDPAADVIWSSAGAIITEAGEQDLAPTTQEGWDAVTASAATLMESANLLLLPGRVQEGAWNEYAQGLVTMGRKAYDASLAKDADALFAAGADLYQVCLACHQAYDR